MRTPRCTLRDDIALWREALRNLPDNPIARYAALAQQRRQVALPWYRRPWPACILVALAAGVLAYRQSSWGLFSLGPAYMLQLLAGSAMLVLAPAYLFWMGQGLYTAVRAALQVLGREPARAGSLQLDTTAAPLGGREYLCGVLAVLLPPLLRRVLTGAVLIWVAMLLTAGLAAANRYSHLWSAVHQDTGNLLAIFVASPLTVAGITLCGTLAVASLLLGAVALGRGLDPDTAGTAAGLLVFVQGLYVLCAFAASVTMLASHEYWGYNRLTWLEALAVTSLAVYGYVYVVLAAGSRRLSWRRWCVLAAPLTAAVLPGIVEVAAAQLVDTPLVALARYTGCYVSQIGALALLNPLALPSAQCWGSPPSGMAALALEWLHYAVLVVLQLALLKLCADFALRSLELKRQGVD